LPKTLDAAARQVHPAHASMFRGLRFHYYWSAFQTEWANDTYCWARYWPCSELSGKSLFVEYDRGGPVDLAINGRIGDCPDHELSAIVSIICAASCPLAIRAKFI
jgi:hypothetical protein